MLGIRLDADTDRALQALSRRTRRSKSDIAREAIARFVRSQDEALVVEARRQSLHAAARGWTEEDAVWDGLAAADGGEPA